MSFPADMACPSLPLTAAAKNNKSDASISSCYISCVILYWVDLINSCCFLAKKDTKETMWVPDHHGFQSEVPLFIRKRASATALQNPGCKQTPANTVGLQRLNKKNKSNCDLFVLLESRPAAVCQKVAFVYSCTGGESPSNHFTFIEISSPVISSLKSHTYVMKSSNWMFFPPSVSVYRRKSAFFQLLQSDTRS